MADPIDHLLCLYIEVIHCLLHTSFLLFCFFLCLLLLRNLISLYFLLFLFSFSIFSLCLFFWLRLGLLRDQIIFRCFFLFTVFFDLNGHILYDGLIDIFGGGGIEGDVDICLFKLCEVVGMSCKHQYKFRLLSKVEGCLVVFFFPLRNV